MIDEDVETR